MTIIDLVGHLGVASAAKSTAGLDKLTHKFKKHKLFSTILYETVAEFFQCTSATSETIYQTKILASVAVCLFH